MRNTPLFFRLRSRRPLFQRINWLKTDTEGYDLHVLRGAHKALSENRVDFVYCEVGFARDDVQHTYFEDLLTYLLGHGYHFAGLFDTALMNEPARMAYANALFVCRKTSLTRKWE